MVLDIIPAENARECRAEHAALTMAMARDDSPTAWAAMLWALALS